ncbi:MAG: shikimate dehydrogenase [SAR324 cluster bacterium]|nr:shikimate dehydrogenase [SAR324 cluster bacterium]
MNTVVAISGKTQLYGVIGHPVAHTLSPQLHNTGFNALGLEAVYLPFPIAPEQLEVGIRGMVALGVCGFNVTVPHKSALLALLDEVSPLAQRIGAVNTVRIDDGRLIGTNTDAPGFLRSLAPLGMELHGLRVGLLGAGGSARALLAGLSDSGASRICVCNRTSERAEELIAALQPFAPETEMLAVSLLELESQPLDLLVNTTTVGMDGVSAPADLERFREVRNVVDIIYRPPQTPLLAQAERLGLPNLNGLGMLLHQGTEAFSFWTGQPAPEAKMQAALQAAL